MDKELVEKEYEAIITAYLRSKSRKDKTRLEGLAFGFKRCAELVGLHQEIVQAELNAEEMIEQSDSTFYGSIVQREMRRKMLKIR